MELGPAMPDVAGVSHRYVDARGLRMHVAEAGEGDPVVLLHTSFQHWYAWRHVIPLLSSRFRVLCPDLRGCGWTDAPWRGYEKQALAADVLDLLEALELRRVRLVGHGLGGLVGFLMCLSRPDRVERYVAVGVPHPWPRIGPRVAAGLWRSWYQPVVAAPLLGEWLIRTRPGFLAWMLRGGGSRVRGADEVAAFAAPLRQPERARAVVQMYRTFLLREFLPLARGRYRGTRLRTPTLSLFGSRDPFFPPGSFAGFEPHADRMRARVLPGEGHFIPEDAPALLAREAVGFFSER